MQFKHISRMNVLMCFFVIAIHLTSAPVLALRKDSLWYFLFFAVNKFCSFAVPAFLFLSGFKLYNKYTSTEMHFGRFYADRARRVLLPYLIAFAVYFTFYMSQSLTRWDELLPGLFLGKLVAHFYYIVIAVQFYLLFPLLRRWFAAADTFLLLASFLSTIYFNQVYLPEYGDRFFATYFFYFILGMWVAKYHAAVCARPSWLYPVLFLPAAVLHIFLCGKMSLGGFWYRSSGVGQVVYVSLAILCIYNLCIKADSPKFDRIVSFFGPYTLYIFLYHILLMNILQFVIFPRYALSIKWQFIITSCVVLGATYLFCLIFNGIKTRFQQR